jgi:hypothetical protein
MTLFKNILTNRLGNLLAILNLLLIAFNSTGITYWLGWKTSVSLAFALNLPSHIIAGMLSRIYLMLLLPDRQFTDSFFNFYTKRKMVGEKIAEAARSKGAKTAHLLRACFCNFCKPILFRYTTPFC